MKKIISLSIFLFIGFQMFSQNERINPQQCNTFSLERFTREHPGLSEGMFPGNKVNESESILIGWGGLTEAFGLSTLPIGLIGDVFEPKALERINKTFGHIGVGIALTQLAVDLTKGEFNKGAMNFTKSGAYWAIGKFGWQGLKIASYGVSIIDYSLNKFGDAVVAARQETWRDAYMNFYKDPGGGNHNLQYWMKAFDGATSKDSVQKIIDAHAKIFWDDDFRETYRKKRTLIKIVNEEPKVKEKIAIENVYKKEVLYPKIKTVFTRKAEIARKKQLDDICKEYKIVINWLNAENTLRARPTNRTEICEGAEAALIYTIDGVQKVFMLDSEPDGYGEFFFRYTRYSLLVHKIKDAHILIKCLSLNGVKTFSEKIELGKKNSLIMYEFSKEPEIDSVELYRADSLRRDSLLRDSLLRDSLKNDRIAKTKVVKDTITTDKELEEIFGLNDEVEEPAINLKDNMNAVFTIMKSKLNVKVEKIKETATHYHGLIISGSFFQQNELIVNKATGELSISYKLKGKRAPWLICKSATPIEGVYSGRIVTNNKHAVDVGYFTFKFKD